MDDAETWAEQQWGHVKLGDARRTRRAVALGAGMARAPGAGLPKQTAGWAGLKGAYRLLDRPEATLEAVTAPHRAAVCSTAAMTDGAVLFVHDDTTIDLTRHNAMQGRGRIGNDGGFGCLAHSCLALAPTGNGTRILGLASQTAWTRQYPPAHRHETPTQRRTRRTEADVWAECIAGIGPCPPGAVWVSVGDRGADVFSHFDQARALGWQCLVRVCQDRRIAGGHLVESLRALPAMASRSILVREGSKRRQVEVALAWTELEIQPARLRQDKRSPLVCVGLRVWNATVEWLLVTTLQVADEAAAQKTVDWYALRWLVEEFHKALKTGCRLEERQLRTIERFWPLLGFLSIVAVRLLQIREAARWTPEATSDEPDGAVRLLAAALKTSPAAVASHRDFQRGVARLGGFLARKGDGEPGWQTLWLGFEHLFLLMLGAQLAAEMKPPRCG